MSYSLKEQTDPIVLTWKEVTFLSIVIEAYKMDYPSNEDDEINPTLHNLKRRLENMIHNHSDCEEDN